jgi:hypothetical protein
MQSLGSGSKCWCEMGLRSVEPVGITVKPKFEGLLPSLRLRYLMKTKLQKKTSCKFGSSVKGIMTET